MTAAAAPADAAGEGGAAAAGTAAPTLHGIPNCDTVKRARAWLDSQGVAHRFHDFKKLGVPADALDRWIAAVGWERLLNRQGTTWRRLAEADKAAVVDATTAAALMRAQPSAIRRPVVTTAGGEVIVGFDPQRYDEALR